jgi:hypothetical protein
MATNPIQFRFASHRGAASKTPTSWSARRTDGRECPCCFANTKLNASLLGFNIDPDFGSVLDALVLVDRPKLEPRLTNTSAARPRVSRFSPIEPRDSHCADCPLRWIALK